jgi:hypothetical protein
MRWGDVIVAQHAPEGLVEGLVVATGQLEELPVHVHRVQPVRLVGDAQLAPFFGAQRLSAVETDFRRRG